MAATTIKQGGDNKRRLADHIQLIAGVNSDGKPVELKLASDGGLSATVTADLTAVESALGATTGAAVVTDANGSIQQYLRGLVKLVVAKLIVWAQPFQYTGVPSSFTIQTADQTVFTLAAGEIGFIQNLSATAPLAVKKGATASTTSLNFILSACTTDSDGTGGAVEINNWVGVVSVAKMTGTAKYLAWKQAP